MDNREHIILCVDDDASTLNLLELHLQKFGYATIRAEKGADAVEIRWDKRVDLIL